MKSKQKVVAIIEARMASTRLPRKVLKPIEGVPVIGHIIQRLQASSSIDEICLATVEAPDCDELTAYCNTLGVNIFRGSEEDVLDRVLQAAYSVKADVIVEICGDCPLLDAQIVDRAVAEYLSNEVDFCSNAIQRVHPLGMDVKVFSTSVLQDVANRTNDPYDHEHVSLYIYENPDRYKVLHMQDTLTDKQIDYRLTLDTEEDFKLISEIYQTLYQPDTVFGISDILTLLEAKKDLLTINQDIKQKGARE